MQHIHLSNSIHNHYAVGVNSDERQVLAQLQQAGEQVRVALTPEEARDFARRLVQAADRVGRPPAYVRYGIAVGQVYRPADGSRNRLVVRDVATYADCDDVLVFDEAQACLRRIDAFKLAMVRYCLSMETE